MIADGTSGATSKITTVNGNEVHCWKFSHGGEYNQTGRQVAAALPRDMDGLRFVEANHDGANLYFDQADLDTDEMWSFEAPDGYEIAEVGQFHGGDVMVELEGEH